MTEPMRMLRCRAVSSLQGHSKQTLECRNNAAGIQPASFDTVIAKSGHSLHACTRSYNSQTQLSPTFPSSEWRLSSAPLSSEVSILVHTVGWSIMLYLCMPHLQPILFKAVFREGLHDVQNDTVCSLSGSFLLALRYLRIHRL